MTGIIGRFIFLTLRHDSATWSAVTGLENLSPQSHPPHLVWINVTANPTAEWIARQITEACPWDHAPQYLIRDKDVS
jgi:hypothetical protein